MTTPDERPPVPPAWPWECLPVGRWLGSLVLGAILLGAGWVLAHWPLTWAALLIAGGVGGIAILLRPALGLPLLALAIPFGSLRSLTLGGASVGLQEVLLAAIVVAWLLRQAARGRLALRWPVLGGAGLLLLAVMLFSFLPATSFSMAAKELVKWVELWLAMLLVVNLSAPADVWLLALGLLVAGAAEALVGLYQSLTGSGPESFIILGRFLRASGTFGQPNPFGGYLGLTLPLAVGLTMTAWPGWGTTGCENKRYTARITDHAAPASPHASPIPAPLDSRRAQVFLWCVAVVSAALMALGLFVSGSRGAWLGVVAALAVVLIARGGLWLRGVTAGGLAIVLVCLLVFGRLPLPNALTQRFAEYAADLTILNVRSVEVTDANFALVERVAHWQAAWAMFRDHPWTGVGIGNYAAVYDRYALPRWQDPLGHAHNYYLNIAAEAGLPGLGAYLLWVVASFWLALRGVRAARGWEMGLALAALGMLVHLGVHNLFDNLYVHGMAIQVGLLLGLAAWVVAQKRPGESEHRNCYEE